MVATLVLVLLMLGFGLLVLGERMGMAAPVGAFGIAGMLALAVVAVGMASVTSRLNRFADGADEPGPRAFAFAGRTAAVLVFLLAFAPHKAALAWVWPAFALGFALAHAGAGLSPLTSLAARLGRLLAGLAMLGVAASLWPHLAEHLAQASGWRQARLEMALAVLALFVLLPGGAVAIGRVQRIMMLVALFLAVVPVGVVSLLALWERADPIVLAVLAQTASREAYPSLSGVQPEALALALGLVGGLAARGFGPARPLRAALGLGAGMVIAGVLVALAVLLELWLARIVGQGIAGVAPQQWPLFVFEEPLQGWLRACGMVPVDPAAAARACGTRGPDVPLLAAQLSFLASLTAPALALANALPILLGFLWGLLPVLLGGAGALQLLHGGALALSETVLHASLNPSGLRSWRLAMARVTLGLGVAGLALAKPHRFMPPLEALAMPLAALTALAGLLLLVARLRQPRPVVALPTLPEAEQA